MLFNLIEEIFDSVAVSKLNNIMCMRKIPGVSHFEFLMFWPTILSIHFAVCTCSQIIVILIFFTLAHYIRA